MATNPSPDEIQVRSYAAAEFEPQPELSISVDENPPESVDLRMRARGFNLAAPLKPEQSKLLRRELRRAEENIRAGRSDP